MSYALKWQLVGLVIVVAAAVALWLLWRRSPDEVIHRLLEELD